MIIECPPEGNTPHMFTTDIFMPVGTGGKQNCSEWEDGTTVDGKDVGLTDLFSVRYRGLTVHCSILEK